MAERLFTWSIDKIFKISLAFIGFNSNKNVHGFL